MNPLAIHAGRMNRHNTQSIFAFCFFCGLTLIVLHPLVWHIDQLPAGGDAYEYTWKMWWIHRALFKTGESPWFAPHLYYPFGYNLCYGEISPINTVLTAPITHFFGEVVTYNLVVLTSTALSGFAMFLLAREVTGSARAGLLAGILFGLAPYRRVHLVHLNLIVTQWLPFYLFFLERFLRTGRRRHALAAGISFGLGSLASWYYAAIGAGVGLVWGVLRLRRQPVPVGIRPLLWGGVLFVAPALALIIPFLLPYTSVAGDWVIPMSAADTFVAGLTDYLIPNPFNPLWGRIVQRYAFRTGASLEGALDWGVVAWTFGLYAWRERAGGRKIIPWLAVVLLGVVFSLGLTLHIVRGNRLVIPAPSPVARGWYWTLDFISRRLSLLHEPFTLRSPGGLTIPMPVLLLRWFVPVVGKMRTWARWGIAALMGMSIVAGAGALDWYRREIAPNRSALGRQLAWSIVILAALLELWWTPPRPHDPYPARPVDLWLAERKGEGGAIIQYPLDSAIHPTQFAYSRIHGWPIVHAHGTYFPYIFASRHPELLEFPSSAALKTLQAWGVRYVLVETAPPYREEAKALLDRIAAAPCLRKVTSQGSIEVYELVSECTP